ncbi:hypothetical protein N7522_006436 [Penicillium canescens]|nr:hypothetical protein N7522_006436 [Penicillium canescens]
MAERDFNSDHEVVKALELVLNRFTGKKSTQPNMTTLNGCKRTRNIFDKVMLGVPGLAPSFVTTGIKEYHATKCQVEYENWLQNYLLEFWISLVSRHKGYPCPQQKEDKCGKCLEKASLIDAETVEQLQGLAPGVRTEDKTRVDTLFEENSIFKRFDQASKTLIKEKLIAYKESGGGALSTKHERNNGQFEASYQQLWLFVMRNDKKTGPNTYTISKSHLADTAMKLGFHSAKIKKLSEEHDDRESQQDANSRACSFSEQTKAEILCPAKARWKTEWENDRSYLRLQTMTNPSEKQFTQVSVPLIQLMMFQGFFVRPSRNDENGSNTQPPSVPPPASEEIQTVPGDQASVVRGSTHNLASTPPTPDPPTPGKSIPRYEVQICENDDWRPQSPPHSPLALAYNEEFHLGQPSFQIPRDSLTAREAVHNHPQTGKSELISTALTPTPTHSQNIRVTQGQWTSEGQVQSTVGTPSRAGDVVDSTERSVEETGDQYRNQGETEIPIRQQEPESPSGSGVTDTHKAEVPKLLEFLTCPTASSHNSVALMERGEVPPSAGDGDHPREEAVRNTLNANGTMTRSGTQAILPGTQDNVERMPSAINSRAVSSTTPGVLEHLSNEERMRFQESVNQICQILSRSTAGPAVQGLDFNSLGGLCQVLGPDRPNTGDDESPNIPSAPNATEKPLPLSQSNESRSHLPRLSDGQELSPDPASTTALQSHFQPEPESSPDVPMPDAHHTNAPPRLEYPMSLLASSHHSDASMVVVPSIGTGYHPPEDAAAVDSDGNVTMGGTEALSTDPQGDDERYLQAHGEVSLTSKMTSVSGQEPAPLAQSDNSQLKGNSESQSTLSRLSEGQALPQGSERTTDIASYVQQEPSTPESYHTPVTPVTWRQIDYPMTSSPPSGNEVAIRGQGDLALSPSAETGAMEDAAGMMDPSGNQIVGGELVPWVGQDHNAEGSSRRRLPIKFGRYGRNGSKWRRFHLAQNTRNLKVKSFSKKLSTTQGDKKLVSRNDKSVEQQGIKLALANSRPRLIHNKMGRTVVRKMSTVSKSQAVQRNNRRSGRIAGRDNQWSTSRALTLRNRASNDPHSFTVTVVPSSTRDFTSILPFPFGEEPPSLPIALSTLAWPAHSVDEVTSLSDSGDRNCGNQSTDGTNIHSPRALVPDTECLSTIEGKRHHPIWEDDGKEGESRKQWLSSRELEYTGDMETDDVDLGIAIRTEGFVPGSRATYSNGSNDSLPMQAGALSQTPNNTPKQPDSNQARPTRPHSVQRSDASPLSATKSDRGVTAPYESTSQNSAPADVQGNSSTHLEAAQEATPTKQSPRQTSIVSPPTAPEVIEENLSPPRPITDPPTNDKGKAAVRNLSPPPLAMEEAAAHHLYPFNDVVLVNTHPQGDPGTQDYPLDGSSLALREKRSLPCAAGDTFVDPLNESHNHNPGNGATGAKSFWGSRASAKSSLGDDEAHIATTGY